MGVPAAGRIGESRARLEGRTPFVFRVGAALPHILAAGFLLTVFVDYVRGDIRMTARVRDASGWLVYELLACVYATVLPLGMLLVAVVRAVLRRGAGARAGDGSLLLLLPFTWVAWNLLPAGTTRWGLLAFLALALARWLPHRREALLIRDGVRAVAGSARRAVGVWSFFTASFLLSAFLVLPLEPLLGLDMPSVEHGQVFLILGIGVIYFVLTAIFDLLDLTRRLLPQVREPARAEQPILYAPESTPARPQRGGRRAARIPWGVDRPGHS